MESGGHSKRGTVKRVSLVTLILNIVLTAAKFTAGASAFNLSLLSDAVHSFSDVAAAALVLVAALIAKPHPDRKHNYGHEKVESLFALFLGLFLIAAAVLLAVQGVRGVVKPEPSEQGFGLYLLIGVCAASAVIKEAMYRYAMHYGKKLDSAILRADAWHNRSDALSSLGVLGGLVSGIFIGTNIGESVAVFLVAGFIVWAAARVLIPAVRQLTDRAADENTRAELLLAIAQVPGVLAVDRLYTKLYGKGLWADAVIAVDGAKTVAESFSIAETVRETIEAQAECPVRANVRIKPGLNEKTKNE